MDHHLRITLAMPEHTDALLAFEIDNRTHFEQWIASRGDSFYTPAAVRNSLEQAQWARNAQKEYHYLAWVNDAIVGRVTLRGAEREHYFKASRLSLQRTAWRQRLCQSGGKSCGRRSVPLTQSLAHRSRGDCR